jgi:hypothetical protein
MGLVPWWAELSRWNSLRPWLALALRLPLFSLGWGQVALDSWAINRAAALCILLHAGDSDGSLGDNGLGTGAAMSRL